MKKIKILAIVYSMPFSLVWIGFILSAFSYNPREVFQSEVFWGVSTVYWFVIFCLTGMIVEVINELTSSK